MFLQKRFFAKYWDHVEDSRDISQTSRFLSGGIGGILSQLSEGFLLSDCLFLELTSCIRYIPDRNCQGMLGFSSVDNILLTLATQTQMMSNTGGRQTVMTAVKRIYKLGGARTFYTGLTVRTYSEQTGVEAYSVSLDWTHRCFPVSHASFITFICTKLCTRYSAIDMSTFEALKLAYLRSTGKEEPGVLAILAFGSLSGSVGATSVYPLNLVRTRLQASGSPGHPQRYTGIWDVASQTYKQSGIRGFYIGKSFVDWQWLLAYEDVGLGPTLAKVIPAVSISYVVYENSKRRCVFLHCGPLIVAD